MDNQGHVSRYTEETYAFITSEPLLKALYQEDQQPPELSEAMFESESPYVSALGSSLRSLESAGIRYILFHKPFVTADLKARFQRLLPVVPVYDDASLAVYDVADPFPYYYGEFLSCLTPDVELASFDVQPDAEGLEWCFRILTRLVAPRPSAMTCKVQLIGDAGTELEEPVTLFDIPSAEYGPRLAGGLGLKESTVRFPQEVETGSYHWALSCPGEATYVQPETVTVHPNGLVAYLRHRADVRYGETIQLEGYRWRTVDPELRITLQWRALRSPHASYKVFVHLLNADDQTVAQYDAVPCDWRCPTNQWQPGEVVLDQATVPLGGLPAGEYQLAVGLYSAETGERLTPRRASGVLYLDDYPVLPHTFTISDGPLACDNDR